MTVLTIMAIIIQLVIIFYSLYIFLFAFAGVFKKKKRIVPPDSAPRRKFAVLIPARNEESSIGQLLKSLQAQDYPSECYDVYVVADNCTDHTADVAWGFGTTPYERFNDVEMTKGYALEFLLDRVLEGGKTYDGFAIFDADNIVDPDFLKEMNRAFANGCHVVQGQWQAKNPGENWLTRLNHASALLASLEQQGRLNLGLSCGLSGTSMAFSAEALQRLGGWKAYCLLEDLEMQARCVSKGLRVVWWPEAISYDETTISMRQASNQRLRWVRGGIQVFLRYFSRLLVDGIKTLDLQKVEHYLWISRSLLPRSILIFVILCFMLFSLLGPLEAIFLPWPLWVLLTAGFLLCFLLGLAKHKADWRSYFALLFSPAFVAIWLWAMTGNMFVRRLQWHKTSHASTVSAEDVLSDR
ncbi:glycosyltransferase family 2 protein [Chloroflexota bacterium]